MGYLQTKHKPGGIFIPVPARPHIQRKCTCWKAASLGGSCVDCHRNQLVGETIQAKLQITEPGNVYEQEADRVAEQVMRMPDAEVNRQDRAVGAPLVQRRATTGGVGVAEASPIVHDALDSPGQPLDAATRAFFEPRFGHDFSRVRVHTDARAVESAESVQALAYTVGTHIVFGSGQLSTRTAESRFLLAHELAHVVQQEGGISRHPAPGGLLQRQGKKNPLDANAKAIIEKAKDASVGIDKRAVQLVNDIITQYYPGEASKIETVVFDDKRAGSGLETQSVGSGATAKGNIAVGTYFVTHVDSFARRVLQVGHELDHINQYRGGLAGGQNKNKREFQAFYNEALADEKPGTGRMSYSTRLALIDGTLGYFYCLSADEQTDSESKKAALLKRREEVNGKAGNEPKDPPTTCKKQ